MRLTVSLGEYHVGDRTHRRSLVHGGLLYPPECLRLSHAVLGLQHTFGSFHHLAGLQPFGEVGHLTFQLGDLFVPRQRHLQGGHEVVLTERLDQICHGAGFACPFHEFPLGERGENEYGGDPRGDDLLRRRDTIQHRHLDVQDDQVRPQLIGQVDGSLTVAGLRDHLIALFSQHLHQIHPDQRLVFRDEYTTGGWRRGCLSHARSLLAPTARRCRLARHLPREMARWANWQSRRTQNAVYVGSTPTRATPPPRERSKVNDVVTSTVTPQRAAAARSTVTLKAAMAVTGLIMVIYLLAHMYGNHKVFSGQQAFDDYAHHLRVIGEPLLPFGGFLWITRVVLLASVLIHLYAAVTLWARARASTAGKGGRRYVSNRHPRGVQRTYASFTLRWGGVVIALFVIYHLAHFTWNTISPG